MKKNKVLWIIAILICAIFVTVPVIAADYEADVVVSLQIDNPIMKVNGVQSEIDTGRGTKPIVTNGRTLVPIRAIIEAFDGIVGWDENTQSVFLTMDDDAIKLVIDSTVAYLNNKAQLLDVAPTVINGRTMLPIRFVAEGFNLGVAWEDKTQTVSIIRNSFNDTEYANLMRVLPVYSGNAYVEINNNVPYFKDYEIILGSFEYYSDLDELSRCNVCMASISDDIMPTEDRESISSVTPTGWKNEAYDFISGKYVYNRCHLIGYQLTGENANERNLITGTRYLNIEGMLPFENMVDDYIEDTGNHVMYRATPVFSGNNLVADGVLLEAYSIEDNGAGISFCIYCYNVQPNVKIDYSTGANYAEGGSAPTYTEQGSGAEISGNKIYRTPTGKRYHLDAECGGKNSYEVTLDDALNAGLTPCQKCAE